MLCSCGQRDATIHEVVIQNGKKVERHLCEQCAAQQGVTGSPQLPISQLISSYIKGQSMSVPKVGSKGAKPDLRQATPAKGCPSCSMTFTEFKKHGLLGCPSCYEHNISRLGALIARAHEGAEQHIGKVPKRSLHDLMGDTNPDRVAELLGDQSERERRLESVRTRLSNAIEHEDYEQAALLRDELTRLASLPRAEIETQGLGSTVEQSTDPA